MLQAGAQKIENEKRSVAEEFASSRDDDPFREVRGSGMIVRDAASDFRSVKHTTHLSRCLGCAQRRDKNEREERERECDARRMCFAGYLIVEARDIVIRSSSFSRHEFSLTTSARHRLLARGGHRETSHRVYVHQDAHTRERRRCFTGCMASGAVFEVRTRTGRKLVRRRRRVLSHAPHFLSSSNIVEQ